MLEELKMLPKYFTLSIVNLYQKGKLHESHSIFFKCAK